MTTTRPPSFESRRREDLRAELMARVRAFMPDWRPRSPGTDAAAALVDIAARVGSEVTQRLDRLPEKAFRGFLDWLGVRGSAARAARLPVVFTMTPGSLPVRAAARAQLQAADVDPPVNFETESELQVLPGKLANLVGADPANDAFFLPPAGLLAVEAPTAGPTDWHALAQANAFATQIQLEPELGLDTLPTIRHEPSGQLYRVTEAKGGLATIEPPWGTIESKAGKDVTVVAAPLLPGERCTRVDVYEPFGDVERNRQEHALYIGSESLLNIKAGAEITVGYGTAIPRDNVVWSYWGKAEGSDDLKWQQLTRDEVKDSLRLNKNAGEVAIVPVGDKKSRWLKAVMSPGAMAEHLNVSNLTLAVNCRADKAPRNCPPLASERSDIAVDAMSNTTPLTLDALFYPLGQEPRLFDAFYLSSPEAFSKPNASVEVCMGAANGQAQAVTVAAISNSADLALFSIGRDGLLHRKRAFVLVLLPVSRFVYAQLEALRPPYGNGGVASLNAPAVSLNVLQRSQLTTVTRVRDVLVAVTAGAECWLWSQSQMPGASRWYRMGAVYEAGVEDRPVLNTDDPPSVSLFTDGVDLLLLAVHKGRLYEKRLTPGWEGAAAKPWTRLLAQGPLADHVWKAVVPVVGAGRSRTGASYADGALAVDDQGAVFLQAGDKWSAVQGLAASSIVVPPLAIRLSVTDLLIAMVHADGTPEAYRYDGVVATSVASVANAKATGPLDWTTGSRDDPVVVFPSTDAISQAPVIATWFPLADPAHDIDADVAYLSAPIDDLRGAPAVVRQEVAPAGIAAFVVHELVASGASGELLRTNFTASGVQAANGALDLLSDVLLVPAPPTAAVDDDFVVADAAGKQRVRRLIESPVQIDGSTLLYRPNRSFPANATNGQQFRRAVPTTFQGDLESPTRIKLDATDTNAAMGRHIMIGRGARYSLHKIDSVSGSGLKITITPPRNFHLGPLQYDYVLDGEPISIDPRPRLDTHNNAFSGLISAIVSGGAYFMNGAPAPQRVLYRDPASAFLVFNRPWLTRPRNLVQLAVNGTVAAMSPVVQLPTSSARVSWEYWDGTAWRSIKNVLDGTSNLVRSGAVTFCVPTDLKPTDVAGRTSHWIRGRLVEGDYGREKFVPDTKNVYTRNTDDIHPPTYASVDVYYSVCCETAPDYVITRDGGGTRDQSAANLSKGATLELFAPLDEMLRVAGSATGASLPSLLRPAPVPPPDCIDCAGTGNVPAPGVAAHTAAPPDYRALYLGFEVEPQGGPISLLFLVDEGTHDGAYPLVVETLGSGGFEAVTSDDRTRGLNETGEVTFSLTKPPVLASLFGSARFWLRLRPSPRFDATEWRPHIRRAYLNGTWAIAAESQSFEMLGSSDGSPNQRLTLARPPLVQSSLTLRVREPLDDEEQAAVRKVAQAAQVAAIDASAEPEAPHVILDTLDGRPGPWVLWRAVVDPADEPAEARVYAVDHDTGVVTFGDGTHGKIPPVGRDGIMAEHYRRAGGSAANNVVAWSHLNLVTPLQGVDGVVVPEGAAGGADPQTAEAILQFAPENQFMRERALTLHDFEELTLQFSDRVAQVRASSRGLGVALVVVMRGDNPAPSRAFQRELLRHLATLSSPMLAERNAVQVLAPELVMLRVQLLLTISDIERSGAVTDEVTDRLEALFDPATGAVEGRGWRLGELPTETDVAAAIVGSATEDAIDGLEEIDTVRLWKVGANGALVDLPKPLGSRQLIRLATNGVTVELAIAEAGVPS